MHKLYQILLTTWAEYNSYTRILVLFSSAMTFLSIIIFVMNITSNTKKELLINDLTQLNNSLQIIKRFDDVYPGKWRHYLKNNSETMDISELLNQFQISVISFKEENNTYNINGEVENLQELTNAIDLLYNGHGLVVNRLTIDHLSNKQIIFEIDFTY
tara:strand:- start:41 stop:514 length:474 start_codon:yes stop_codon:yes gene_type:complete